MNIDWNRIRDLARTKPLRKFGLLPNSFGSRCITGWMLVDASVPHQQIGAFSQSGFITAFNTAESNRAIFERIAEPLRKAFGADVSPELLCNLIRVNDTPAASRDLPIRRLVAYCDLCEASDKLFDYWEALPLLPKSPADDRPEA